MKSINKAVKYSFLSYGLFVVFVCCFIFFACGLDTYIYIEAPEEVHISNYQAYDNDRIFFAFQNNKNNNPADLSLLGLKLLGTEVYYKIYNNADTMESNESRVSGINSSTTSSTTAADYLLETLKYKQFKLADSGSTFPLFQFDAAHQGAAYNYGYIIINDMTDPDKKGSVFSCSSAKSSITELKEVTANRIDIGEPRRYIDSRYGFNFNRDDENNPLPSSNDDDVIISSSGTEDGVWYMDLYAITVGMDNNFQTNYSKVLFLGSISIRESDFDK